MTTTLPTLFDAAAERDAALTQVAEHAGDWPTMAYAFLRDYARGNAEVFGDDLWLAGLPEPPNDRRALGGVLMRARREGWLVATGRTRPRRSGHLTAAPLWKSLLYRGDM